MSNLITMDEQIEIHPSSVPLLMTCGQSIRHKGFRIDYENTAALEGSAAHEAIAQWLRGNSDIDLDWIAEKWHLIDAPKDEFQKMFHYARNVWKIKELDKYFDPETRAVESQMIANTGGNVSIVGTADVIVHDPVNKIIRVLDWKTGRVISRDYSFQLLTYLVLAAEFDRMQDYEFWTYAIHLRDYLGGFRKNRYTYSQLVEFYEALLKSVNDPDPKYIRNSDCGYCPRFTTCPAIQDELTAMYRIIKDDDKLTYDFSNVDEIPDMIAAYKLMEKVGKQGKDTIMEYIDQQQQPLVLSDGRTISRQQIYATKIVDVSYAFRALKAIVGTDSAMSALSMSKTAAEKVIQEASEKRQGAKNKRAYMEDLENAKAVQQVPFSKKLLIKQPNQKELPE